MAEETKCIIMQMVPKRQQLRDRRVYTEAHVKRILRGFAHDLGCDWPEDELTAFIETAFDFD